MKHGKYLTVEYSTWNSIRRRCYSLTCNRYKDYGGRGIKMCKEWYDSFEQFLSDMGNRPSPSHSIDRIDVNGNYEPSNCRWATSREQSLNKRNSRLLTHNGVTKTATEWAAELGLSDTAFFDRIKIKEKINMNQKSIEQVSQTPATNTPTPPQEQEAGAIELMREMVKEIDGNQYARTVRLYNSDKLSDGRYAEFQITLTTIDSDFIGTDAPIHTPPQEQNVEEMAEKTRYVVGFLFNEKETDVLLIEKQKPLWQKGKFNGLGGKIEPNESPLEAIRREVKEESGIDYDGWKFIVTMYGDDWSVDVFTGKTDDVFNYQTLEKEEVGLIPLAELDDFNLISNLYWLIPMCLDKNDDHKSGINYGIRNLAASSKQSPSPLNNL